MQLTDARKAAEVCLVLVLVAFVAGQALGQPVFFGYVETGSMEPTIDPEDGFVAVPAQLGGSIQEGDVVVFEAEEVQGGGLTTHRVVGETEDGYVTRGDANPFTDQSSGEPPVKRTQVVAKALQVGDQVVVVPRLGAAVQGIQSALTTIQRPLATLFGSPSPLGVQGLAYLFFAVSLGWYVAGELRTRDTKRRDRDPDHNAGRDVRMIFAALSVALVLGATVAMVAPAGTQEYGIVSSEYDSDRADVVPMGESKEVTYPVDNGGIVPTRAYLEPASDGTTVRPNEVSVQGRSSVNATVTLHAPPETGYYRRVVTEHRYLALLPASVTRDLYEVHPWAPIVAIDALIAVPFYLFCVGFAGSSRVRDRSRDRVITLLK